MSVSPFGAPSSETSPLAGAPALPEAYRPVEPAAPQEPSYLPDPDQEAFPYPDATPQPQAQQPPQAPAPQWPPQLPGPWGQMPQGVPQAPQAPQQPAPWQPPAPQPIHPPALPPTVDQSLTIPQVVEARKGEILARYSTAYQHAMSPEQQQAIQLAYTAEVAKLEAQVERTQVAIERHQAQQREAQQRATTEPLYRQIAAQRLSERYGVPMESLLRTPWGEEITDPQRMLDAALYLSANRAQTQAQQGAAQSVAPSPTGGRSGPPDYGTMSDDEFERHVMAVKEGRLALSA